jgi:hypothetical protein
MSSSAKKIPMSVMAMPTRIRHKAWGDRVRIILCRRHGLFESMSLRRGSFSLLYLARVISRALADMDHPLFTCSTKA